MHIRTQTKLAHLLKTIGEEEAQIENARQSLAKHPEFEPYTVFKTIDTASEEYLSVSLFQDFLRDNKVEATDKDVETFFKLYNVKGDGRLTYYDFINFLLPKDDRTLRTQCCEREPYYSKEDFKLVFDIKYGVARTFERLFESFHKLDRLRKELLENDGLDLLEAYELISDRKPDAFDQESLQVFLKKNKAFASERHITSLLRHADKDKDGRISYIEFVEIITPLTSQIKPSKRSQSPRRTAQPQQQPSSRHASRQASRQASPQIRSQRRSPRPSKPASGVETPVERGNRFEKNDGSKIFSSSLERLKKYETFADTMKMSTFSSRSPSPGKSVRSNRSQKREASSSPARASPVRAGAKSLYSRRVSVKKEEQGPRNSPLKVSTSPKRKERVSTTPEPEQGSVVGSRRDSFTKNRPFVRGGIIIKNGTPARNRSAVKTPGTIKRQSVVRRRSPVKRESPVRVSPVRRESVVVKRASPVRRESSVRRASPLRRSVRAESPVKKLDEREIVMMLKKQIDLIKGLEKQKTELAFRRDFNLMNAFGIFDADKSGSVTKSQLQSGFEALEIFVSPEQMYLIISILDKDTDGLVMFEDFIDLLTPTLQNGVSFTGFTGRPSRVADNEDPLQGLAGEALGLFKRTLTNIVEYQVTLEEFRRALSFKQSGVDTFKILDRNQNGFITLNEFQELFHDYGFSVTKKEVLALFNKHEKHEDSRISYSDYIQEITPKRFVGL